jgi:sialate O-acetylesterase
MLAEIPNTGMAVTSDLGHPSDVHPRNKKEIGHRLALWAMAKTYEKKVPFSGPLVKSVRRDGATFVVNFDHADGGLKTADGKMPRTFTIAGADGVFHTAEVLLGSTTATLKSEHVANPLAVRYGWQPYSDGNLVNGHALPASTFQLKIPQD